MHTVRMLGDGDGARPSLEGAARPVAAADLRTMLRVRFALLEATLVVSSELGLSHQELDLLLTLASAPARRGADLSSLVAADGDARAAPLRRLSERGLVCVRQSGLLRRGSRARLSDDGDQAVRAALRGLARELRGRGAALDGSPVARGARDGA